MKSTVYNYGIFNCLIFPLEKINNKKKEKKINYINSIQNNCVSLYDCFMYNQKADSFKGNKKFYCNNYNQLYDSLYISKIFSSPKILILILDRGKHNKYDLKLDFKEDLDISQFVLKRDQTKITYSLYGVITYIDQSFPNAHFVALCKSPIDNKWYRYDDDIVKPIKNVNNDIIEFGTPYILFYEKN